MQAPNPPIFNQELNFEDWGLVEYSLALERQLSMVEKISETDSVGAIIFCTHPPVVTLGRATQSEEIKDWTGATIEVSRGGRSTYHGPSQLVVYPIINLKYPRKNRKEKEVVGLLRDFENAIVKTLEVYNLKAQGKSVHKKGETTEDATGVWVNDKKIASLGMSVKKWVTFHGAAINLDNDPQAFKNMMPCGFSPNIMTNLEVCTGKKISHEDFKNKLRAQLNILI